MTKQFLSAIFLLATIVVFAQQKPVRNYGSSVIISQDSHKSGIQITPPVNVADFISKKLFGSCVNISNIVVSHTGQRTVRHC